MWTQWESRGGESKNIDIVLDFLLVSRKAKTWISMVKTLSQWHFLTVALANEHYQADRVQLISKASITFCFMATFVCSSCNWLISLLKVWDLLLFLTHRARALSSPSLHFQTSRLTLVCCFVVQKWSLRPVCVRQALYTRFHGPMACGGNLSGHFLLLLCDWLTHLDVWKGSWRQMPDL